MSENFGKTFWEQRWGQVHRDHAAAVRDLPPNSLLVATACDLTPGTALDAGCGHGADAIWLASRGWRVTAVDIATTALHHAREQAETLGRDLASRIDWVQADLTSWTPAEEHFDLVSAGYLHPAGDALFRRLAAAVAPGGTLLVVGHDPSDPLTAEDTSAAQLSFTAEEVAAGLDPGRWDIVVSETRPREATDFDGRPRSASDAVVAARRLP